jgi:DNA-binding MarR family transcriptional regulator
MEVVAARQPVSQREVSEALGLDPADMVAVIDLLVDAQYVQRDRDPADRRRYALVLTRQGRRALDRLEAVAAEATEAVLATLSASERAQLHRLAVKAISE